MVSQKPKRYRAADELGPEATSALGDFVYQLTALLQRHIHPVSDQIVSTPAFSTAYENDPPDIQTIGEAVRTLIATTPISRRPVLTEGGLYWQACIDAIQLLHASEHSRTFLEQQGIYTRAGIQSPPLPAITMQEIAQRAINQVFPDGAHQPPKRELQTARIAFTLLLDPHNTDAFIAQGTLAEQAGLYEQAREFYQKAIDYTAEKVGTDAFQQEAIASGKVHFWHETKSRQYMEARRALAWLLWKRLGNLSEAIIHFQAMLALNPDDNQGNRDALLCALAEQQNSSALQQALRQLRTHRSRSGDLIGWARTCWHYTYALHLFQHHREATGLRKAQDALEEAFLANAFVPLLLTQPDDLPDYQDLGSFTDGDATDAAWYTVMARKAWNLTPGALDWLLFLAEKSEGIFPTDDETPRHVDINIRRESLPQDWHLQNERTPPHEDDQSLRIPSYQWGPTVLDSGLHLTSHVGVDCHDQKLPAVPSIPLSTLLSADDKTEQADPTVLLPGTPGSISVAHLVSITFYVAPDSIGVLKAWPTEFQVRFTDHRPSDVDFWQEYDIRYDPNTGEPLLLLWDRHHEATDPTTPPSTHIYGKDFEFDRGYYYGSGNHFWLAPDYPGELKIDGSATQHQYLPPEMVTCLQGIITKALPSLEIFCIDCRQHCVRSGLYYCQHIYWCVTCRRLSTPLLRSRKYASVLSSYRCSHQPLRW